MIIFILQQQKVVFIKLISDIVICTLLPSKTKPNLTQRNKEMKEI